MKFKINLIAFLIISVLGTVWHFVYDWSGENFLLGLFFPVNENTWEHLKLLFFPTIIYSFFEYFIIKERPKNYVFAVCISLLLGMFTIVTLYYLYSGVLGKNITFIDISLFFISVLVMLYLKTKIIKQKSFSGNFVNIACAAALLFFGVLFCVYSYNPPSLGIFLPPSFT